MMHAQGKLDFTQKFQSKKDGKVMISAHSTGHPAKDGISAPLKDPDYSGRD
jgi:hypothetical protein